MFDRVLVPLDGSRGSGKALAYASEISSGFGSVIILLRVEVPSIVVSQSVLDDFAQKVTAAEDSRKVRRANRYLNAHVRRLKSQGIQGSKKVLLGDPGEAIMRVCRQERVDLVVMATRGRGGLSRAIMGSVTDLVIRESDVPVLVVRR